MATYHVFIERPRDTGATATARLATAVADRYGIPAQTLVERLAAGRLRVKTGVDRETADTFAADLESLGAVCSIIDAATNEPVAPPPRPAPPPKPAAAPPPKPAAPSSFSSALSAARTGADAQPQDLGALSSGEFALATLDGDDDQRGSNDSFGPPDDDQLPASMGPAIAPVAPIAPVAVIGSIDAFAPPGAEAELVLDVETRAAKPVGTTAPVVAAPQTMAVTAEDAPPPPSRGAGLAGWIRNARIRFAGGVLVAILLGFVPASLVTSMREGPAFAEIDKELSATYRRVADERDWLRLDEARARALTHKQETRRDIALASMLLWALVAGGIAYVWFRVIDWDALAARF